ncbi:helix-turn-helix domain-containing protein [Lactobacillus helveticus]|uniref:helix-turn-helix domain-containing protein n=1 Tax=Lactobacillus helveticus TaxID=1587 RepID=UPI0021820CAD|nr:helix-turn-helix domain-containing protein [Lactobacillus helveticus]
MNNVKSEKTNINPNLHIPTALIKNYRLSALALLVYGELNGLYSKHKQCFITDKALSERLNRSIASIQRAIRDLKNLGLITSKQKPHFKGRLVTVPPLNAKKFLLIPVAIVRNHDLSIGAMLLYGSLYSRQKKLIKINTDKYQEDAPLIICVTKSELADEFRKTSRAIGYQLKELEKNKYINLISNKGINVEITLVPLKMTSILSGSDKKGENDIYTAIKFGQKVRSSTGTTDDYSPDNLGKKRASTYEKNVVLPRKKMSIDLGKKRATNRTLIEINKEKGFSSNKDQRGAVDPFDPFEVGEPLKEPVYYDSIPNANDAPPIQQENESLEDIAKLEADLNELDQRSSQRVKATKTGKGGSEVGTKDKQQGQPSTQQAKATGTGNTTSRNASNAPKPKQQKSQYEPYNGFNIDYQVKELQEMLRRKTKKRSYIITFQQKTLIQQRLKDGFTLYDFEKTIDYLIQQNQAISLNDLIIHLPDYLNKINSN